jgi:hypothetical protein
MEYLIVPRYKSRNEDTNFQISCQPRLQKAAVSSSFLCRVCPPRQAQRKINKLSRRKDCRGEIVQRGQAHKKTEQLSRECFVVCLKSCQPMQSSRKEKLLSHDEFIFLPA